MVKASVTAATVQVSMKPTSSPASASLADTIGSVRPAWSVAIATWTVSRMPIQATSAAAVSAWPRRATPATRRHARCCAMW